MEGWLRPGTPVVFVSHGHPFVHLELELLMDCVSNTFRSLEFTGERGLLGDEPLTGTF